MQSEHCIIKVELSESNAGPARRGLRAAVPWLLKQQPPLTPFHVLPPRIQLHAPARRRRRRKGVRGSPPRCGSPKAREPREGPGSGGGQAKPAAQ